MRQAPALGALLAALAVAPALVGALSGTPATTQDSGVGVNYRDACWAASVRFISTAYGTPPDPIQAFTANVLAPLGTLDAPGCAPPGTAHWLGSVRGSNDSAQTSVQACLSAGLGSTGWVGLGGGPCYTRWGCCVEQFHDFELQGDVGRFDEVHCYPEHGGGCYRWAWLFAGPSHVAPFDRAVGYLLG